MLGTDNGSAYTARRTRMVLSGLDYRTPKEVAAVWEDGFRSLSK